MRLPILLTAALFLSACQPPAAPEKDAEAPAAQTPVMPADAPPQEDAAAPAEASSTSCTLDQGSDGAMELVRRCMAVSTASHPPCNPENPCKLIQDEIDRSCAIWDKDTSQPKPKECTA